MTTTQLTEAPVQEAARQPTRGEEVVAAIVREAGVSGPEAAKFVRWIVATVGKARRNGYASHFLTTGEIQRYHDILDAVAPDDTVARDGSTHALLERHVLDRERGEVCLMHSKTSEPHPRYCTVTVRTVSVTT